MIKKSIKKGLAFSLFICLLYFLLPLEYDNFKIATILQPVIFICLIAAGLYILPKVNSVLKILMIAGGSIATLGTVLSYLLGFLCAWGHDELLYKSKKNKSLTIVCRRYGCYGTTDDCEYFKIRKLTANIKWVTDFTINPIDTTQWKYVPFESR